VFKQFQLHESLNFEIRGEFFNLFNFEVAADQTASLDYIHRRSAGADIYFIRNTQPNSLQTIVTLRVNGRQPKVSTLLPERSTRRYSSPRLLTTVPACHSRSSRTAPFSFCFAAPAEKNNVTSIVRDRTILYSGKQPDRMPPALALTAENEGSTPVLNTPDPGAYEVHFRKRPGRRVNAERTDDISPSKAWTPTSHPIGARRLSFN
jgi:hypothetical protein